MRLLTVRSFLYSLALHTLVITLLIVSFDSVKRPVIKPEPEENILAAVTVDNREVEKELQRLKDLELQKQRKKEQELKALERKARAAEEKRKKEQKRLADLREKEAREKKRKAEEKKRAEEAKKKAEAERKRIEERKKARAERKRIEEEKKKAAEQALKEQLEKERQELKEAQRRQDQNTRQNIIANIKHKVTGNFNKTGLPKGLECLLSVQTIPGGEVISVTVNRSSGNAIFDRRAIVAVEKASPLPLPVDATTFDRLGLRKFKFRFIPED